MPIRLIALDLDDTLLREDLSVSEGNRKAVREAEDSGIEIVLASGRNYRAMLRYVRELGLEKEGNYLICSNGAETHKADTGAAVERLRLSRDFCHEAAAQITSRGFQWQVYQEHVIYCSELNPWALRDEYLSGLKALKAPPLEALFEHGQIKFVIPGEPERLKGLGAEFSALFAGRAEIITSKPYFLEILPLGADKGSALHRLTQRLGIPMEATMAIGDAMNDLGMLKAAGWGCAPANAIPEVKRIARVVSVKTNEEDAVADLIRTIALGSTAQ